METLISDDPRYPIGKFKAPEIYDEQSIKRFITEIEETPLNLKKAVEGLSEDQLNAQYRSGGWSVRQVVHHLPDSHLNAYVRMKLTLTEDKPLVKSYEEHLWAELHDSIITPVSVSLDLLESLHRRWVILIKGLSGEHLNKHFNHPVWGLVDLKWLLAQYAWHGKHHVAHVTSLRERKGW